MNGLGCRVLNRTLREDRSATLVDITTKCNNLCTTDLECDQFLTFTFVVKILQVTRGC